MKVSVITVCFNAANTIENAIKSVLSQTYPDIEYIIIDGASIDRTLEIIRRYENNISKLITEPDNGIYDALNKGIRLSTGDIIGFLHADDFYAHENVIKKVVQCINSKNVDSCYGDLVYIDRKNPKRIIRYWKSRPYKENLFKRGWMPPHPAFFVKRWVYEKYGLFDTHFKIAADYEIMLRFLYKYKISTWYIPEVLVKMRVGGISNRNLKNIIKKSIEDYKACRINKLKGCIFTIILKNISKIPQLFRKDVVYLR